MKPIDIAFGALLVQIVSSTIVLISVAVDMLKAMVAQVKRQVARSNLRLWR